MKICILECLNKSEKVIDAHLRNCLILKKEMQKKGHEVDLEYNDTMQNNRNNNYDIIVVSYASFYCNHIEMKKIIDRNKEAKLFWMTNEYDLSPNGSVYKIFKERECDIIANFEKKKNKFKSFKKFNFLKLNTLMFEEKEYFNEKKYDICYYGTYRKNRVKYFKKYFDKNFHLSTSSKNFKKFKSIGCDFKPIGKMNWGAKDTLSLFRYSLYIEDEYTHDHYNCLANRFYEAVMNDVVLLFDSSCINTLKKSEIKNENFMRFVVDKIDLNKRDYEEDLKIQREWKKIIAVERKKVVDDFEEILKKASLND